MKHVTQQKANNLRSVCNRSLLNLKTWQYEEASWMATRHDEQPGTSGQNGASFPDYVNAKKVSNETLTRFPNYPQKRKVADEAVTEYPNFDTPKKGLSNK
jgi:hypothetical protein